MILKPISSEKAVKMVDLDNTLLFQVERREKKENIKKEIEEMFKVKVVKVRTLVRNNKKYVYIKLKKETPAIDIATKLGLI